MGGQENAAYRLPILEAIHFVIIILFEAPGEGEVLTFLMHIYSRKVGIYSIEVEDEAEVTWSKLLELILK